MLRQVLLISLAMCAGCSDFNASLDPTVLSVKCDGPDLPRYIDKREQSVALRISPAIVRGAISDVLLILGCENSRPAANGIRADRPFVPGLACGIGGESLYVTTESSGQSFEHVRVVSYKRFPFAYATRFLDGDFCDLLSQCVHAAEIPEPCGHDSGPCVRQHEHNETGVGP